MQNELIISSMMKYSLQNRGFPQKIDRLIHKSPNASVLIFKTSFWQLEIQLLKYYYILFCFALRS
jgi:hypothetical protein